MLGVSGIIGSTTTTAVDGSKAENNQESGGGSGGSSEVGAGGGVDENERIGGGGGNRWPRQETVALLKIRSDMDVSFRDASLKGPLWEEVSRKMGELGFQRSAKKCKEKFENVFKYHKRTKDGRASKQDAKAYRFFDQLEALESPNNHHFSTATPMLTVPSASPTPLSVVPPIANPINSSQFQLPMWNSMSSSTSSDEDRRGRKRKWKDYLEKMMAEVVQKQEDLQKKFLEALEKRERDRIAREEAWRVQELARLNRERDLLIQERSAAAAKDAAVISFLKKVSGQADLQIPTTPPPPPQPTLDIPHNNGGDDYISASSSRWPKAEVEALIKLRKDLEVKYQESGPKGPLWEEISKAMSNIGYKRSSKRCKEKWENINKYFKKVRESNKKRPEDSKTCPYFNQLDAMYKERAKTLGPIMAQPEQQWPQQQQMHDSNGEDEIEGEDEEDEAGDYEMVATNAVEGG